VFEIDGEEASLTEPLIEPMRWHRMDVMYLRAFCAWLGATNNVLDLVELRGRSSLSSREARP